MKALVTTGLDPLALELSSVPDPRPRPDEALIEVHATSVNRADLLLAVRRPVGSSLGLDLVGTVLTAAADGSGPPAGTRVAGIADNDAWAELATVRTGRLAVLPDELGDHEAATLPVAGLTALYALRRAGSILGQRVLVTAAGGGVGRTAVQLALASGAEVTGWVGSAGRAAGLEDFGARTAVGYGQPPAGPFDVLVDSVGGEVFTEGYRRLGPGGVAAVFGNTVRAELRLPADWGHARPGVRIEYLYLLDEITRRPVPEDLGLVLRLAAGGRLAAEPGLVAPWTDPHAAVAALLDRKVNGKVVLSL
ncbi:zinc-binding dehydrogenase [uncultured Streptomyces sp.]|uniref:zinc-binding dehydrogenase n=1 Tax=uncultured Streptomyces sp. TaxID=174707 RepID=UPI00261ECC66|nr:zinc-binding dehydrogenase [uncultured Streptomyces sp.]